MPIIRSAKKKLRQDRKREKRNDSKIVALQKALKAVKKNPTAEKISKAVKLLDKLAKNNLVHKNKAARIKSRLSKLIKPKTLTKKPSKNNRK